MSLYQTIEQIRKSPEFTTVRGELFRDCEIVVSAPGVFFWSGEHNVIWGGPAICQHIPLRVWVGLTPASNFAFGEYREWNRLQGEFLHKPSCSQDELFPIRKDLIIHILKREAKRGRIRGKYKIKILTDFKCGGGADWSGAFSAALATAFLSVENPVKAQEAINNWNKTPLNQLLVDKFFNQCFRLGWEFDNIFHASFHNDGRLDKKMASGYGPFCSLVQTDFPIFYFKQPQPIGTNVDPHSSCYGFRFKELLGRTVGKNITMEDNFPLCVGLIYSGEDKDTGKAIAKAIRAESKASFEKFANLIKHRRMYHIPDKHLSYMMDMVKTSLRGKMHPYYLPLTANTLEQFYNIADLFKTQSPENQKALIQKQARLMISNHRYLEQLGLGWKEAEQIELFFKELLKLGNLDFFGFKLTGGGTGGYLVWTYPRNKTAIIEQIIEKFNEARKVGEKIPSEAHLAWVSSKDGFGKDGVMIESSIGEDIPDKVKLIRNMFKGKNWNNAEIIITKQNKLLIYRDGENLFHKSFSPERDLNFPPMEWQVFVDIVMDKTGRTALNRLYNQLKRNKPNQSKEDISIHARGLLDRYVSNIRKILKYIFGFDEDPIFPKKRNQPYEFALKKISCQKKVLDSELSDELLSDESADK